MNLIAKSRPKVGNLRVVVIVQRTLVARTAVQALQETVVVLAAVAAQEGGVVAANSTCHKEIKFAPLLRAYSELHRFYHTPEYVNAMWRHFDIVKLLQTQS